ncbi:MAG TPA: osmotically inducible protein OsmC, partial [Thermoanaerobaculia bacterium]|nr:osmotically inducible protein OsmC [Thermoanaerobaculia bacterium]
TCAGLYALRFCQQRQIPTAGLAVRMVPFKDETSKRIALLDIELTVPPGFPEKYRAAILRAIDQCAVKRHMIEPPDFTIRVV